MNYQQALIWAQKRLSEASISSPRLDALVLLEDNTGVDRAKILYSPDQTIKKDQLESFKYQIEQRCNQTPLAYIRHITEFYGRQFYIDNTVLEPRPESEAIIDELKDLISLAPDGTPLNVVDIGTGSGALIITAKAEFPAINAIAVDISSDCLGVALKNQQFHSVRVNFLKSDLTKSLEAKTWSKNTIVLANLPYVPTDWQINPPAKLEPALAIFGGKDGLRLYKRLFSELGQLSSPPLYVITESMPPQHQNMETLASKYGYSLVKTNDFIQVFSYLMPHPT